MASIKEALEEHPVRRESWIDWLTLIGGALFLVGIATVAIT